jgi:hypothetical protein
VLVWIVHRTGGVGVTAAGEAEIFSMCLAEDGTAGIKDALLDRSVDLWHVALRVDPVHHWHAGQHNVVLQHHGLAFRLAFGRTFGMAQQAEDALAAARDAAERYARLHVARVLLRSGIDRFRKEQQGPVLRTAGKSFALLTDGRYERLIIDYDAADRPVLVAIRDIGTECPVEAL